MDFEQLADILNIEKPVSFREFVTGEDYCNNQELYEYWFNREEGIPETCSEIILDGSIGSGKTWFSNYYMAYRVYKLLISGNPQKVLELAEGTEIFILYFSVSLKMAQKSGFQNLYNIFAGCKWFQRYHPINLELKSSIEFVNDHIHIDFASSESHQIGLTIWGFILDEANFRSGGVGTGVASEYEEVTLLYNQLIDRLISRFSRSDGSVAALAILISSASFQSSFVEKRKEAIKDDPHTHVITSVSYEVKPWKYSKETFDVFIGAGSVEACILTGETQRETIMNSLGIAGTGEEEHYIRHIPVNLRKQFTDNIVLALQNHCGVPTMLKGAFMSNLRTLFQCYDDDIKPIFTSFKLQASTGDDSRIIDNLIYDNIEYADRPHSIFLDLSIQHDTCAISCWRYDGKDEKNLDQHTRVFLLEIIPPEYPNQTRISKIQDFIIDMSQVVNLVAFASDQYQSTGLRQEIQEQLGLEDIRISVDSSDIPHMHWQRALVEQRISETRNETLERECQECTHDWQRHRVVKSKNSSDDVLQAEIGGFFLSDTYAKNMSSLDDLYSNKQNLIGGQSIDRVLKKLGYTSY